MPKYEWHVSVAKGKYAVNLEESSRPREFIDSTLLWACAGLGKVTNWLHLGRWVGWCWLHSAADQWAWKKWRTVVSVDMTAEQFAAYRATNPEPWWWLDEEDEK